MDTTKTFGWLRRRFKSERGESPTAIVIISVTVIGLAVIAAGVYTGLFQSWIDKLPGG